MRLTSKGFAMFAAALVALTLLVFFSQIVFIRPSPAPDVPPFVSRPRDDLHRLENWDGYVALGHARPSADFPQDELIALTTAEHARRRAAPVTRLLPCYGNATAEREGVHNFVILPIGCFGDPLDRCTSCTLSMALVNATYCGREKMGLFLGDNFYPSGISSRRDRRFVRDLRHKFYRFRELQMTYYATSGNHDKRPKYLYRNNGPQWTMPSPYYSTGLRESAGVTLEMFVFSTNPHEARRSAKVFYTQQAEWLDAALQNSTAQWRIVATHEPIFGFAGHGHHPECLQLIHPVLRRHAVQLLVTAHTHGVYLHRVEGGYHQLISAGFADSVHESVKPRRPRGYNHLGVGATMLLVGRDNMTVVAMDRDGSLIFHHEVPRHMDRGEVKLTAIASSTQFDVFKLHAERENWYPLET